MGAATAFTTPPRPEEVAAIVAIPASPVRNLRITECYHRLSAAMAARTGGGANWCTFATWASKQAGQTIRGEDLLQHLTIHSRGGWSVVHPVQSVWRALLRRGIFDSNTRLGSIVKAIHSPFDAFERASEAVARGNRKVFEEIGWEFARYLDTCGAEVPLDGAAFLTFLEGLRKGPPPEGQDLLAEAFTHYQQHGFESSPAVRLQLLFLANLKIGLHEQTRLQPEILEAIEAAPETVKEFRERLRAALFPYPMVSRFLSGSIEHAAIRYRAFARAITRRAITDALMVLALPGGVHRLGAHLPAAFASGLEELTLAELRVLWDSYEPNGPECADCGAKDWAALPERMHYIIHLFRCYHADASLLAPPFSQEQVAAMRSEILPSGSL